MEHVGDVVTQDDRTYIVMLDKVGNNVLIDCTEITAAVVAAIIRTIIGIRRKLLPKVTLERTQNAYNRFLSAKLKEIAIDHPDWGRKQRLDHAVTSWAAEKERRIREGSPEARVTVRHDVSI